MSEYLKTNTMKKLLLIPLLLQVFACSTDEMDEERDTSTFTGLYDGYSWVRTEINQGVNLDETIKSLIYFKNDMAYAGYMGDATNIYGECEKRTAKFINGGQIDGFSDKTFRQDVFFEVNTPEQLMIILTDSEYPDEFNSLTFTGDESTLYVEDNEYYNGEDHIYNMVYKKDDSFTWDDFQNFTCD
tara:strand:+ start:256 stop:813 length:558 start_codon:yes stop_codon:yes gene_type:complete